MDTYMIATVDTAGEDFTVGKEDAIYLFPRRLKFFFLGILRDRRDRGYLPFMRITYRW